MDTRRNLPAAAGPRIGRIYSVPVRYGHHNVVVRGYVERVVISCGTTVIATHVRSCEHEGGLYDPLP